MVEKSDVSGDGVSRQQDVIAPTTSDGGGKPSPGSPPARNRGAALLIGALLAPNAALSNNSGFTQNYPPTNSPVALFSGIAPNASLAAGASTTLTLQFTNSNNGAITYTTRVLNSVTAP